MQRKTEVRDILRSAAQRTHDIGLGLAAITLIVITLIVLASVLSRYIFNQPIPGSNELIGSCLMVALIYLALSSANHIRITAFTKKLSNRVREVIETLVSGVCLVAMLITAYAALGAAIESYVTNESTVGLWTFDIYPYRFIILIGVLLLALRIGVQWRGWLRAEERDLEHGQQDEGADAAAGEADPVRAARGPAED